LVTLFLACLWLPAIQAGVSSHMQVAHIMPDVVLCVVVIWSMLIGGTEALLVGFFAGLILDLVSGNPLGVTALALVTISLLTGNWRLGLRRTNPILQSVAVFIASLVYYSVLLLVIDSLDAHVAWWDVLLTVAIPSGLLNVIIALPLSAALHRTATWLNGPIISVR